MVAEYHVAVELGVVELVAAVEQPGVPAGDLNATQSPHQRVTVHSSASSSGSGRLQPVRRDAEEADTQVQGDADTDRHSPLPLYHPLQCLPPCTDVLFWPGRADVTHRACGGPRPDPHPSCLLSLTGGTRPSCLVFD